MILCVAYNNDNEYDRAFILISDLLLWYHVKYFQDMIIFSLQSFMLFND